MAVLCVRFFLFLVYTTNPTALRVHGKDIFLDYWSTLCYHWKIWYVTGFKGTVKTSIFWRRATKYATILPVGNCILKAHTTNPVMLCWEICHVKYDRCAECSPWNWMLKVLKVEVSRTNDIVNYHWIGWLQPRKMKI